MGVVGVLVWFYSFVTLLIENPSFVWGFGSVLCLEV